MSKLGVVEDTLFVPMLGRIYASEYCPQILYDPKALELKKKLPSSLPEQDGQSQYTLLASAARSANMDRYIRVERRGRSARLRSGDDIFPLRQRKVALVCRGFAPCGGVPAGAVAGAGAGDLSCRRCLC